MATTVRCPKCQRKNSIPAGAEGKARCGACQAPLAPARGGGLAKADRADAASPFSQGSGGPGSPWGPGGPPAPSTPWGPSGLGGAGGFGGPGGGPGSPGGAGGPFGGGGDPSGARMRQARRTGRTSATGSGPSPFGGASATPGDLRAVLVRRWDELLRLAPADMGLTAALGESSDRNASDPIAWLSKAADVPREALEEARQIRNGLAANRPTPDSAITSALATLDRAFAALGHLRFPD